MASGATDCAEICRIQKFLLAREDGDCSKKKNHLEINAQAFKFTHVFFLFGKGDIVVNFIFYFVVKVYFHFHYLFII